MTTLFRLIRIALTLTRLLSEIDSDNTLPSKLDFEARLEIAHINSKYNCA